MIKSIQLLLCFYGIVVTNAFLLPNNSKTSLSSRRQPLFLVGRTTSVLPEIPDGVHRIVLMRHGESEFNNANVFTGWCDVALTPRGVVEAQEAGQVFASHSLVFRKCYSSVLTRSIVTAMRCLEQAGVAYTPLTYDWRFNERHYGALQGLSKERTAERLGKDLVMKWRRSYESTPPAMTKDHPHFDTIQKDPRYKGVAVPASESLKDCQPRVLAGWNDLLDDLREDNDEATSTDSKYTLLVAHANTLRALIMYIDNIPEDEVEELNIPTGIPFYYDVHVESGQILQHSEGSSIGQFTGAFISDERKQRSFLERRRVANDPWLWALNDDQVDRSMLLGLNNADVVNGADDHDEVARNTELFSSAQSNGQWF